MKPQKTARHLDNSDASNSQRQIAMVCIALLAKGRHPDVAPHCASGTGRDRVATVTPEETCLASSLTGWSLSIGEGMEFSSIAIEAAYRGEWDFALWLMAERLPSWDIEARLSLHEAGPRKVADYLKLYKRPTSIDYDLQERMLFAWAVSEGVRDSWIQFDDGTL